MVAEWVLGRGRAVALAFVVGVAGVSLSGCTSVVLAPPVTTTVVVTSTVPVPSPGSAAGSSAASGSGASSGSVPLAPPGPTIDATSHGIAAFSSPTGNISCLLIKGETATFQSVRCDVLSHTWVLPPKPADCEFDWSHGAYLEGGHAGLTCASDAVAGSDAPGLEGTWWASRPGAQTISPSGRGPTVALAYGASIKLGTLTCLSQTDGVHCTDSKTGHGFDLSRAAYRLR